MRSVFRLRTIMSFLPRILVIPFCLHAGFATANEPLALQPAQVRALGIETAVSGDATTTRSATFPARVVIPNEQLRVVAAPVDGLIEMLAVAPGQTVRRGQLVARMSSLQALELQRDALQAQSQAELLEQNLRRDEQLFAEGLIAESRLQAARAAAVQALAQAGERRQSLILAGGAPHKLGGTLALVSPIDGVVLEQSAQTGQHVAGTTPLYRIAQLSPLWLEIQVPESIAANLVEGMLLKVLGNKVAAKLVTVSKVVDPASQTVLLRAVVDQGSAALWPGRIVDVEFDGPASGGQRIPSSALVRHAGQVQLFVQTASDAQEVRFEPRPVRILSQGGDSAVVSGLSADERVAVKGVSGLKAILSGTGQE